MRSVPGLLAVACGWLLASGCKAKAPAPGPAARPAAGPAAAVADRPAILAELPVAPDDPATPAPDREFVFAERGGGVAYVAAAGGKFRVVHDGRAGGPYEAVSSVVLSPDGRRCAHVAWAGGAPRVVVDGKEGPAFDEIGALVFSLDGTHFAYAARAGGTWHLVVDGTVGPGIPTRYRWHAFGAEGSRIAFVDGRDDEDWGKLVVSDLALARQTVVDPRVYAVALNADASRVAAIAWSEAGSRVVVARLDAPERASRGAAFDFIHRSVFGQDGATIVADAERAGQHFAVLDGREVPLRAGEAMYDAPAVRPGGGAGVVVAAKDGIRVRRLLVEGAREEGPYDAARLLVFASDGRSHAYVAERGGRTFVVSNGHEGPPFESVVSPAFSPDGRYLVYRARRGGERFVVVADRDARTIRQLPPYEEVYPVQFTADGKSIAYGVKDGRQLAWKVEPLPSP